MLLEVWHGEVYTGSFYRPAPGDVVIDAGANIGLFSILIARLQPKCMVYAYEPFEENYRLLNENLTAAGASNVKSFPFAITGASGLSTMLAVGERSQDHRLATALEDSSRPTVRTCTLEEVLAATGAEKIQMFKCDIEGSEHDLFASAPDAALRRCQRLAIEYHDNIRPGTLSLLKTRLAATHRLNVEPSGEGYGMLYAVAR